jgi:hypothetical protein
MRNKRFGSLQDRPQRDRSAIFSTTFHKSQSSEPTLCPPQKNCALSQKKVKDPAPRKANKNAEHEGDEKIEE